MPRAAQSGARGADLACACLLRPLRRHMHERGAAHRDLKSPNLLLTADWRVKVRAQCAAAAQQRRRRQEQPATLLIFVLDLCFISLLNAGAALLVLDSCCPLPWPLLWWQVADFGLSKLLHEDPGVMSLLYVNPKWQVWRSGSACVVVVDGAVGVGEEVEGLQPPICLEPAWAGPAMAPGVVSRHCRPAHLAPLPRHRRCSSSSQPTQWRAMPTHLE